MITKGVINLFFLETKPKYKYKNATNMFVKNKKIYFKIKTSLQLNVTVKYLRMS